MYHKILEKLRVTSGESGSEKCRLIELIRLTRYGSLIERLALAFFDRLPAVFVRIETL
jgi:hypothetical protein